MAYASPNYRMGHPMLLGEDLSARRIVRTNLLYGVSGYPRPYTYPDNVEADHKDYAAGE